MILLAKIVKLCAVLGANCVSICGTYQPKLPKTLQ